MAMTARGLSRIRFVLLSVATAFGAAAGLLATGCPADVTATVVPVPGALVGITISPANGPVTGGTVVTFNSANGGFDTRTSVLFGEHSAAEVRVYNGNVMTAVAPPGAPGSVDLRLHAPVDSSLRVMIGEAGVGTVQLLEADSVVVDVGPFTYYITPSDSGEDGDHDGLSDAQELAGWEVWIDSFAFAPDGVSYFNSYRYKVTSDPTKSDTDGDGLTDDVEFLIKSDPTKVDSDGDGLWDGEEWNQWLTSPTNVDTDGDTRGDPDHPLAPNQALFDGLEMFDAAELRRPPGEVARVIRARATSPTLDDTDGDGVSDFDEFDSPVRNGVLADLPLLNYQLVDDLDVKLNVEYAETIGETKEYGVTLTESQTETTASSFSATHGWSLQVMLGVEAEAEVGLFAWGKVKKKFEVTAGVHGEYTFTNSTESSRESSKEVSRVQSDSREFTESAADGSIRTAIQLTNGGNTTFTVNGLGVLVSKHEKKKSLGDISDRKELTIATMTPVFDSITLAPGETAGPFELAATGVSAQSIKELMAAPDTLMLGTANMNFTDGNGLDFDYVRQVTVARTAHLTIDFGDGEVRQYTVATNVDRNPDSSYRGIKLGRVLEDVLGLPFDDATRGYTTMPSPAAESNAEVLQSLLGYRYAGPAELGPDDNPTAFWTLVKENLTLSQPNAGFRDLVLHAGDEVAIIFHRDDDGDGLPNNLEKSAGTDLNPTSPADADGDGLTDYFEVIKGWVVFGNPNDPGKQWALAGVGSPSSTRPGHAQGETRFEPDTEEYGSSPRAWSPLSQNGTLEWITVRFQTPVYASGATIRETWGNGFVYQVDVLDTSDVLHTVWSGTDSSEPGTPVNFDVTWPVTDYLVKGVRVYVDTDANPNTWEEIDAIALYGYPDKRARRVFSDPRFPDADGDGLTDDQEFAGVTPNAGIVVSSDPLDPDTDGDGLLDGVDPFPTIAARTIYVKAGTPAPNNGNSWLSAYGGLQVAINRAITGQGTPENPNDDVSQIWVATGTYKPSGKLIPLSLVNQLSIYGGFTGPDGVGFAGESKRGERNTSPFSNGCVITGDMNNNDTGAIDLETAASGNRAENCPTIILANAVDSSALLDGFLITGAYSRQYTNEDGPGGAIRCASAYPTIQNCLFLANANQSPLGACVNVQGVPAGKTMSISRCIFANNVAQAGGAIHIGATPGTVVVEDCEFSRNEARRRTTQAETAALGGGAYVSSGTAHFIRCAFTGNQARYHGGGIYSGTTGYLRVDSCRFYGNATTINALGGSTQGAGGGIFLNSSSSVSNSAFWDNRATSNGGAVAVINGTGRNNNVAITNCSLVYNRALPTQNGGWDGGGIIVWGGSVAVDNTILWQNYFGASVVPDWDAAGAPQERHQIAAAGGTTLLRNCCLNGPGNFTGRGNIHIDPELANIKLGDLTLGDASPCIDAGDTFVDLDPLLPGFQRLPIFDLAAKLRIADGNGDGLAAVDMGAFEAPAPKEGPGSSE